MKRICAVLVYLFPYCMLATGTPDVKIQLGISMGHSEKINSVCFSPNSKYCLSGSDDWTMKLWDGCSGKEVRTFKGHTGNINSVCFTPDGKLCLSGSDDKTMKLWNASSGQEIRTFPGHTAPVNAVCIYSAEKRSELLQVMPAI
jgi:WD40 repeat protein